ncbi:MAG: serine hydrolase domain-containing protein [bacterium]
MTCSDPRPVAAIASSLTRAAVAIGILLVPGAGGALAQAASALSHRPPLDSIELFLRAKMRERRIPGLQIAIVQHGRIAMLGAYGISNVEDSVPTTRRTVFPIASITKAFTGVALMQLVESGTLELDAPISTYVDSLPTSWRDVTVRQLATHMSGLPDIWDANSRMIAVDADAAWAKVQSLPLQSAPGQQFSYNQTNYVLLGRVIERLAGGPFTRFIKERQLDAAGMQHTMFGDMHDVVPHLAGNYWYLRNIGATERIASELNISPRDWPPFLWTAVGLNASAEDLAHWIIALQSGGLLRDPGSLAKLWTPGVAKDGSTHGFGGVLNGYALGWPVATRPEHRAVAPTGGGRAALFIYPDDDLSIVVLTNVFGAAPQSFIDEVAAYFIPEMHAANGFGLSPAAKTPRKQ